jgi:UDP-2,4-diacetamido-2,4,6-trideoxy-beta-L-altropyranose hydrolase
MIQQIAIRVDGSAQIGTGHVQRCLSLADALRRCGAEIVFVTRLGGDAVAGLISRRGFRQISLSESTVNYKKQSGDPPHAEWAQVDWLTDADQTISAVAHLNPAWVLIDHYAFDARWHNKVQAQLGCKLAVIDDLGDRPLSADLVIDHNPVPDPKAKYAASLNEVRKFLTGSRYALLDAVYGQMPARRVLDYVKSVGIFMGGADADNLTCLVIRACRDAGYDRHIEVVSTGANPNMAVLKLLIDQDANSTLSLDLPNLADFFSSHDMHIGAGGGATWERCCAGAPSIVIQSAENQTVVVDALIAANAAICCRVPASEAIKPAIKNIISQFELRCQLSSSASKLVDGKGSARVAAAIGASQLIVRPATLSDGPMVHQWRNDSRTRSVSRDTKEIALADHLDWFAKSLENPKRKIWIGMLGSMPTGLVRFDTIGQAKFEVSIFLDPDLHAIGLGAYLLRAGEAALAASQSGAIEIHAEALLENTGSQAMFARQGYEGGPCYVKTLSPEDIVEEKRESVSK